MRSYYHVTGPKGSTMHLRPDEIDLLIELGFVKHERTLVNPDKTYETQYYVPGIQETK